MATRFERDPSARGPVVNGFSGNGFRIGDQVYARGLWLTPEWARAWDAPALEALEVGSLDELLAIEPAPEFLLLGTGATMRRPAPGFSKAMAERGIGVEAMDSRAAARAWGMLRGEGRWIAAALLPLG